MPSDSLSVSLRQNKQVRGPIFRRWTGLAVRFASEFHLALSHRFGLQGDAFGHCSNDKLHLRHIIPVLPQKWTTGGYSSYQDAQSFTDNRLVQGKPVVS